MRGYLFFPGARGTPALLSAPIHWVLSAAGVGFENTRQKLFRGYGAELRDPDGYLIYTWDEKSMREKGWRQMTPFHWHANLQGA